MTPVTFDYKVDGGAAPPRPEFDAAFGPCRLTLPGVSPWSDRYEVYRQWGAGCDSRSHPGHHASYYTFTLQNESRVRMHVEGSSAYGGTPLMILRSGASYAGEEVARGSQYRAPEWRRIDQVLDPGTYTLEVATEKPGISGLSYHVRIGTPATPPVRAGTEIVVPWSAVLTVRNPSGSNDGMRQQPAIRCDDSTTSAPTPSLMTAGNYEIDRLVMSTSNSSNLVLHLSASPRDRSSGQQLDERDAVPQRSGSLRSTSAIARSHVSSGQFHVDTLAVRAWAGVAGDTVSVSVSGATTMSTVSTSGTPDWCFEDIDHSESAAVTESTDAHEWHAECPSTSSPGSYSTYYHYEPEHSGMVEITLTSPDADEELYLWEGDRQVNEHSSLWYSCLAQCAYVEQWVEAGETYVIEVTSDKPAADGKYLLALRRYLQLWNTPEAPVAHDGECRQVVAVTGDDRSHSIRRSFGDFGNRLSGERWAWPCHSVKHAGHYANYYTFELTEQRAVSIELTVPGGGHLILRKGTYGSGPILGESDSRKLSGTLAAGTYTVEVAMNAPNGNGHSFNLEIKAGRRHQRPADGLQDHLGPEREAAETAAPARRRELGD